MHTGYEFIKAEVRGSAGLITLNRPKALNALCDGLMDDLMHAARAFDADDAVGAIVITGSDRAFAAGADIKEMSKRDYVGSYLKNQFKSWGDLQAINKPTIAAVSGFALGGRRVQAAEAAAGAGPLAAPADGAVFVAPVKACAG